MKGKEFIILMLFSIIGIGLMVGSVWLGINIVFITGLEDYWKWVVGATLFAIVIPWALFGFRILDRLILR